jgi:hypothetical protein
MNEIGTSQWAWDAGFRTAQRVILRHGSSTLPLKVNQTIVTKSNHFHFDLVLAIVVTTSMGKMVRDMKTDLNMMLPPAPADQYR